MPGPAAGDDPAKRRKVIASKPTTTCEELMTLKEARAQCHELMTCESQADLKDCLQKLQNEGAIRALKDLLAASKQAQAALQKASAARVAQLGQRQLKQASQSHLVTVARQGKKNSKSDSISEHCVFNVKYDISTSAATYTEEKYKAICADGSLTGSVPFVVATPWLTGMLSKDSQLSSHVSWWKPRFQASPQYTRSGRGHGPCPKSPFEATLGKFASWPAVRAMSEGEKKKLAPAVQKVFFDLALSGCSPVMQYFGLEHLGLFTCKFQIEGSRAVVAFCFKELLKFLEGRGTFQPGSLTSDQAFQWLMNVGEQELTDAIASKALTPCFFVVRANEMSFVPAGWVVCERTLDLKELSANQSHCPTSNALFQRLSGLQTVVLLLGESWLLESGLGFRITCDVKISTHEECYSLRMTLFQREPASEEAFQLLLDSAQRAGKDVKNMETALMLLNGLEAPTAVPAKVPISHACCGYLQGCQKHCQNILF